MTSPRAQDLSSCRYFTVGVLAIVDAMDIGASALPLTSFALVDNVARTATLATIVAPTGDALLHTFDTGADLSGVPRFVEVRGNGVWTCWTPEDDPGDWSLGIEATATRVSADDQQTLQQLVNVAPDSILGDPSGVAAEVTLTRVAPPKVTDVGARGTGSVWRMSLLGDLQIASITGAVTNRVEDTEVGGDGIMWVGSSHVRDDLATWTAALLVDVPVDTASLKAVKTALDQTIAHA